MAAQQAAVAEANEALDLDCPICMQPFLEPMLTSCGHAFCRHCIQRALCPPDLYADDYKLECPICRGLVGILEPSERLARLVAARYGDDYADCRRNDADVPSPPLAAAPAAERDPPREQLMEALRRQGGYRTLELNSTLDLSCSGWERLPACLPELSRLRQLRVEHNLLRSLEHLALPSLLALIAHHNQIQQVGDALLGAPQLVRLDLSHNLLTHVDGLACLRSLSSLYLAANRLSSPHALDHLRECAPTLDVLDLRRNALPAEALEPLLSLRTSARVLYLQGNPLVQAISAQKGSYRKFLITALPSLSYLDDHPIDAPERGAAEAWMRGGEQGERDERARQQLERVERVKRNTAFMMEKKRLALLRRGSREAGAAGGMDGTQSARDADGGGGGGGAGAGAASSSTSAASGSTRLASPLDGLARPSTSPPLSLRDLGAALGARPSALSLIHI